jgi:hypothetical protein
MILSACTVGAAGGAQVSKETFKIYKRDYYYC